MKSMMVWWPKWIEVATAVTAELLLTGVQILDRETIRVKFHRDIVITS